MSEDGASEPQKLTAPRSPSFSRSCLKFQPGQLRVSGIFLIVPRETGGHKFFIQVPITDKHEADGTTIPVRTGPPDIDDLASDQICCKLLGPLPIGLAHLGAIDGSQAEVDELRGVDIQVIVMVSVCCNI